jgi:ADP-heptose:LPS heptosyltransferase
MKAADCHSPGKMNLCQAAKLLSHQDKIHSAKGLTSWNLAGNPTIRSIAVFRALQLGDVLCIVPCLRALRYAFPFAHIVLITLPWGREFAERFSYYVDEHVEFPGHPLLPERHADEAAVMNFISLMRIRRFDLMLQMHGSGQIVNELLYQMEPRRLAGFYFREEDRMPGGWFIRWPEEGHEIHRFLSLVTSLGITEKGDELEYPVGAKDRHELASLPVYAKLLQPYACIHPGARMRTRRWLAHRFAQVGDFLAAEGYQVVLTGSNDERDLVQEVADAMAHPVLNMAGCTSMGALGALLEQAEVLVCNDTGISHVACGLGTPSVVITMGSDPLRWAPLDRTVHRLVIHEPISCRPCYHEVCPVGHPCAYEVTTELVTQAVKHLLLERHS